MIDPEHSLDVRDMRKALWAVDRAPEMAYMLRTEHRNASFLARLHINAANPPVVRAGDGWVLEDRVRCSWSDLEDVLLFISNTLLSASSSLPEARFPFNSHWALPRTTGYRDAHKSFRAARHSLWRARDALFLLAARCTLAVALLEMFPPTSPPRWQRILTTAGLSSTWIDELADSIIVDLSPGLRVGAFIDPLPGENMTQWVHHIPCMVKANLPVYIFWPTPPLQRCADVWEKILRLHPHLRPYLPRYEDAPVIPISDNERIMCTPWGFRAIHTQTSFSWEDYVPRPPPPNPTRSPSPSLDSLPHGPGQRPGETFAEFRERRARQNQYYEETEKPEEKIKRLEREAVAITFARPRKRTTVFIWTEVGDEDPNVHWRYLSAPYRRLVGHHKVGELWATYDNEDKHYDSWRNEWDIFPKNGLQIPEDPLDVDGEDWYYERDSPPAVNVADANRAMERDLEVFYAAESTEEPGLLFSEDVSQWLESRYGILLNLPSTSDSSASSHYTRFNAESVRRHFGLTRNAIEDAPPDAVRSASAFLVALKDKQEDITTLVWDLSPSCPSYLAHRDRQHPSLQITRWKTANCDLFAIQYDASALDEHVDYAVLVDALTAVELFRRRNIRSCVEAVTFLAANGISFRTVRDFHPLVGALRGVSLDICLGWRHRTFQATPYDYASYERRARDLLSGPRGRAAILRGGIVWRLACLLLDVQPHEYPPATRGPSEQALEYGEVFVPPRGSPHYDDALSNEELDLVCGTYKVWSKWTIYVRVIMLNNLPGDEYSEVSFISWWPRVGAWYASGLDFGCWTPYCEEWFQRQLTAVHEGTRVPQSGTSWRHAVRQLKEASKVRLAVEEASHRFLIHDMRVGTA